MANLYDLYNTFLQQGYDPEIGGHSWMDASNFPTAATPYLDGPKDYSGKPLLWQVTMPDGSTRLEAASRLEGDGAWTIKNYGGFNPITERREIGDASGYTENTIGAYGAPGSALPTFEWDKNDKDFLTEYGWMAPLAAAAAFNPGLLGMGGSGYTGTAAELAADGLGGVDMFGSTALSSMATPETISALENAIRAQGLDPATYAPVLNSGGTMGSILSGLAGSGLNLGTALGALAGFGGLGDAREAGTTTQTTAPWQPMQANILGAADAVKNAYNPTTPSYLSNVNSQAQSNMGMASNLAKQAMGGQFDAQLPNVPYSSDPIGPNQYMNDVSRTVEQRMNRNLGENILPQIRSGAVANGYGSSRQGIAEGLAMRDTQNQINESIAPLYAQGYEQYANRLQNNNQFNSNLGLGIGNQNIAASTANLNNRLSALGGVNQSTGNAYTIGSGVANYPMQQATQYASAMGGLGGLGGQTTSPYYSNPWGNALGMAQLGTGLWNMWS